MFSEENIEKDFEIVFTFSETVLSNDNLATLLNAMDESNSSYPGFNVRVESNNIVIKGGSGRSIPNHAGKKLKIFRSNSIIYSSIDDEAPVKLMDNPKTTFQTTVLLGCTVLYNNQEAYYSRYYKGEILDVSIKIFGKHEIVSKATQLIYSKPSLETWTKTNNNKYINTGIKLFDEINWGKDFEVSFNIDNIGSNANQATLFNALFEKNPYPGVLLRIQSNKLYLELSYLPEGATKNSTKSKQWNFNEVSQITIKRKNNILYYSINNSQEDTELYSCQDIGKHDIPVIFGSSVASNGTTYNREFKGTLSNMVIKLEGETVFQYNDRKTFDGTMTQDNRYEVTDIKLFDEEHMDKDFTISFNIDNIGENIDRATILAANIEEEPWYGLSFRIQSNKLRLEGNNGKTVGKQWELDEISQISLKKIDNTLYFSVNNKEKMEILLDYSSDSKHDIPVTFGCYLKDNEPGRFFNGKISNIKIYIEP